MPTTQVSVGYRPIRVAALVSRGSNAELRLAAIKNTHYWGGVFNPIIEVDESVEDALAVIRRFSPDLVSVIGDETPTKAAVKKQAERSLWPLRAVSGPWSGSAMVDITSVRFLARHYAQHNGSGGVLPSHSDEAVHAVLLGAYSDGEDGDDFRRDFAVALSVGGALDPLRIYGLAAPITPLGFTSMALERVAPDQRDTRLFVVVGSSQDAGVLVQFWNLRAAGVNAMFWPTDDRPELCAWATNFAKRALRARDAPSAWVVARSSRVPARLVALFEELGISIQWSESEPPWDDQAFRSATWSTERQSVVATLDSGSPGRNKLTVALPPSPFGRSRRGDWLAGYWLATISPDAHRDLNENETFLYPNLPELNAWAEEQMGLWGGARVQRDGIGVVADTGDVSVSLVTVTGRQIAEALFTVAGFRSQISPAGEATERIVKQLGGLGRTRVLRLHNVRNLLTDRRSRTFKEAQNLLKRGGAHDRYGNVPDTRSILKRFLEQEILLPRLAYSCPACSVSSEASPDDLGRMMRCPNCASQFSFAPLIPDKGTEWRYRPSGFFANHHQHGAIPVVLTMLALNEIEISHDALSVGSHNLQTADWEGEVDFVHILPSRSGRSEMITPVLALGECKGRGGSDVEFTASEIAKLVRVSDAFRALGAECYVVLSTTRTEFTDSELSRFRKLVESWATQPCLDSDGRGQRLPLLLVAEQIDYWSSLSIPGFGRGDYGWKAKPFDPHEIPRWCLQRHAQESVQRHLGDTPYRAPDASSAEDLSI